MTMILAALRNTRGATRIEHALIAALVAVAAIAAMKNLSSSLSGTFNNAAGQLKAAAK